VDRPDTRKADYSGPRWGDQCAVNIGFGRFHCHVPVVPEPRPLLFPIPTSHRVELNMKDRTETLQIGSSAPDFSLAAANRDGVFSLGGFLKHAPVILEFLRGTW